MNRQLIFLIVNPVSGLRKGKSILKRVQKIFNQAEVNLKVVVSQHENHPYELAKDTDLNDVSSICLIGGDGTMHEVINGMLDRSDGVKLPIGLIPAGSGNALMHDLDCVDPEKSVKAIINGDSIKLDLFRVKARDKTFYAFNILGWGTPSRVNQLAARLRIFGTARYNIASCIELLRNKTERLIIEMNGESLDKDIGFFMACNTKYTGNGMQMAPQAILDDGYLDVLVAGKLSRLKLIKLFLRVFKGKHLEDPSIDIYKVKSFKLRDDSGSSLIVDGQITSGCPVEVEMIDERVEVFGRM